MRAHLYKTKNAKGYTIIELLLVIAIIVILASTILVSINAVKIRAKSVAAMQMTNSLLKGAVTASSQNNGNFGTHWTFPPAFSASDPSACNVGNRFDGNTSAQTVCKRILESVGEHGADWELLLLSPEPDKLSVMARLPNGKVYCAGSNDRVSAETDWDGSGCGGGTDSWICPGCPVNVVTVH